MSDTGIIVWLQQFSPVLDAPFALITILGNESFFLLFLPLVYWCIHRRIGARLSVLFLFSATLNAVAKAAFGLPRPFMVDPAVLQLVPAGGNGFPSGHTQGAVVVWTYLAVRFQSRWLWGLAAFLMLAIPLSRLYLGVHFPLDLAGGYLLGGLLVWGFLCWEGPTAATLRDCATSGILALLGLVTVAAMLAAMVGDSYLASSAGALVGACWGLWLQRHWIGGAVERGWRSRAMRYGVGMIGLVAIYLGLKLAFGGLEPGWFWRWLRYVTVGGWTTAGAPWLFGRLFGK